MSQFMNSVIRQLGRDTGKVLSNSVFGDSHSTPIRMTGRSNGPRSESNRKVIQKTKSEFEKALPYAEAAHRIDSANAQAITMLSGIHFGLNDMEKSDAYKAMLGNTTQSKTHTYEAI